MAITFACGQCKKQYNVDASLAGKRVKCKSCGAPMTIPAARPPDPGPTDEVDDPYGLDEGVAEAPRPPTPVPVLPRTGGRRPTATAPAASGVPPWVWVAGGGGGVVVIGLAIAVMMSGGSTSRPVAKGGPVPVAPGGDEAKAPAPGFQRDDTSAAATVAAWQVKPDPAAQPLEFPPLAKLAITVPEAYGSDYILFPTTPSPFVILGGNSTDEQHRDVWDLRTGTRTGQLKGKIDVFKPSALSPDGAYFVTHTLMGPKNFDIWRVADAKRIARIADDGKHLYDLVDFVAPGEGRIILGSNLSKLFQVWDFLEGQPLVKIETQENFEPESVAFSPGRRYMALMVSNKNKLQVYDVTTGGRAGEYQIEKEGGAKFDCRGMAFSPDGTALAGLFTVGNTARLLAWDATTGALVSDFHAEGGDAYGKSHSNSSQPVQWLPDQSGWFIFDENLVERHSGQIVWNVPFAPIKYKEHGPRKILDLGRVVALADVNNQARLQVAPLPRDRIEAALKLAKGGGSAIDATLPPIATADLAGAKAVESPAGPVAWTAVAAPARGARPPAAGKPVPVRVPAGDILAVLVSAPEAAQALVVSSPGGRLSEGKGKQSQQARRVDRYDLAAGRPLGTFEIPSVSTPIAFSPGASRILMAHSGGADRIDVLAADGEHVAGWRPYGKAKGDDRNVAWADFLDPERVLTVNPAGTLVLWSIPACKAAYVAEEAMQGVPVLSPDRKALAVLRGGALRILDPATGLAKGDGPTTGHKGERGLLAAAFDPGGQELAAVLDGQIVSWDLKTGQVVGEYPSPLPKAGSLQFGNARHVLLDGKLLFNLGSKKPACSYEGGVHARGGSGALHVYAASEQFNGPGALRTIALPEKEVARVEAMAADPKGKALLRDGAKVSLQVVGSPSRDAERFRRELTEALTGQLRAAGIEVAEGQPVKVVATFRELDSGQSLELRMIGTGETRTMQIRHLEWALSVADDKGPPVVIAKDRAGHRGGLIQQIPQGENDWEGYLRTQQWFAGSSELIGFGVPYFVARRPEGGVFLPGRTNLGHPTF